MAEKTLPLYAYVAHERESPPPPVGVLDIFVWHLRLLTIITNFIFSSVKSTYCKITRHQAGITIIS